jgi:hypothetical protein
MEADPSCKRWCGTPGIKAAGLALAGSFRGWITYDKICYLQQSPKKIAAASREPYSKDLPLLQAISSDNRLIYDVCMARRVVLIGLAYLAAACVAVRAEERVTSGLVMLYAFEEGAGTTVRDRASAAMARYTCTDQSIRVQPVPAIDANDAR